MLAGIKKKNREGLLTVEMAALDVIEYGGRDLWRLAGGTLDLLAQLGGADFKVEIWKDGEFSFISSEIGKPVSIGLMC